MSGHCTRLDSEDGGGCDALVGGRLLTKIICHIGDGHDREFNYFDQPHIRLTGNVRTRW